MKENTVIFLLLEGLFIFVNIPNCNITVIWTERCDKSLTFIMFYFNGVSEGT